MPTKSKKMIELFRLVSMPTLERVERGLPETLIQMSEHLDVMYPTIIKWHHKAKLMGISKMDEAMEKFEPVLPKSKDEEEWAIFMKQLTSDAATKGATAPTRTLYAQLKGKMPKTNIDLRIGLSADEIARRNLEASRQLEEGGY